MRGAEETTKWDIATVLRSQPASITDSFLWCWQCSLPKNLPPNSAHWASDGPARRRSRRRCKSDWDPKRKKKTSEERPLDWKSNRIALHFATAKHHHHPRPPRDLITKYSDVVSNFRTNSLVFKMGYFRNWVMVKCGCATA